MKAFKKIASFVIAASMLASIAPMSMAADTDKSLAQQVQEAIKTQIDAAFGNGTYEVVSDTSGKVDLKLNADTVVKKDSSTGNYGDNYISESKRTIVGTSLTGDFKSTLYMAPVLKAFDAYKAAANSVVDAELGAALLPKVAVNGEFQISVVFDKDMSVALKDAHVNTLHQMYGFNDSAKAIFDDYNRQIVSGAVLAGTDTAIAGTDAEYDTLLIDVKVKAPVRGDDNPYKDETSLIYADLEANAAEYFKDIEYTVDDVTVTSTVDETTYYTESIEMAGSITIGRGMTTINFTTVQGKGDVVGEGENNYDAEDWQKISATMGLKKSATGGGSGGGGGFYNPGASKPNATVQPGVTTAPRPDTTATPGATQDPNATPDPNATATPVPTPEVPSSTIPPVTPADNKVPSKLNGGEDGNHYVYIIGYPEGDVRPEGNITREEVATIFYRILSDTYRESIYTKESKYSDVLKSRWSNKAIATLTNGEVSHLKGYPDGTFKPASDMTRLEFVQLAASFLDESDAEDKYLDNVRFTGVLEQHAWGEDALQRAAKAELLDEEDRANFRPDDKIKRHEAFKIINRLLVRYVKEGGLMEGYVEWPDNPKDAKYFYEVVEATNSHNYERIAEGEDAGYEKWTSVDQNWIWGDFKTKWEDPDEIDKQ